MHVCIYMCVCGCVGVWVCVCFSPVFDFRRVSDFDVDVVVQVAEGDQGSYSIHSHLVEAEMVGAI